MRSVLYACVLCLLSAVPVSAQTNPVPAGQPFAVLFDHSGLNVTGFQCVLDGKPVGSILAATARQCAIPGLSVGVHTVTVTALNTNAFGTATASSAPLTATAGTPPPAPQPPTNLRLTVDVAVSQSGDVTLLAASVTKQ